MNACLIALMFVSVSQLPQQDLLNQGFGTMFGQQQFAGTDIEEEKFNEIYDQVEVLRLDLEGINSDDVALMTEAERKIYYEKKREFYRKRRELAHLQRLALVNARKRYYAQLEAQARRKRLSQRRYYWEAGQNVANAQAAAQRAAMYRFYSGVNAYGGNRNYGRSYYGY